MPPTALPARLKRLGVFRSIERNRQLFSGDTLAAIIRGIVARAAAKAECSEAQVAAAVRENDAQLFR